MEKFYVNNNAQSNGDHEVHRTTCPYFDRIYSKKDLGYHDGCHSAVQEAKKTYRQSNGCATCCSACHTS
ncbi:hypothetical protein GCM10007424_01310 [Flavobacterium suaedae]|uniref:Uncharacterized protein n=1 Tax=Flavobacterium suaedae TaxID=1767027 RepID=A0ABQ1JC33_9FLAO|nr:hypothetical protein [Flavobacterium suaedae]GGB65136.1 hypothetical protein GCM10007424_01310 [Flavobacterium suaedae]